MDITSIRAGKGVASYLIAVIDGYTRQGIGLELSNMMDAGFCVDALGDGLPGTGRHSCRLYTITKSRMMKDINRSWLLS